MNRALLAALVVVLAFAGCGGRPDSTWPARPQFRVGVWDVYHDTRIAPHEAAWLRATVAEHIALSNRTTPTPQANRAPHWTAKGPPYVQPAIRVYASDVHYLNSPIRVGVTAYADNVREEVHATMGAGGRVHCPGLAVAVHSLRVGRADPWRQDAALGWSVLFPAQARLEAATIASR